jgi:hypothetical protein
MKMTFCVPATVFNTDDQEIVPPAVIDGWRYTDDTIQRYLDFELADAGICGGELRAKVENGQAMVLIDYWGPANIASELIEQLEAHTLGQLDDGIGEGGFEIKDNDDRLFLVANTGGPIRREIIDDGRLVPEPSHIAIAARDGNLLQLRDELQSRPGNVDLPHQGCTGLQYAVLHGHLQAVHLLLRLGADCNRVDPDGNTPLELCALSNSLNDEESRTVAQWLLESGAIAERTNTSGYTAKSYALLRGKIRTAEIL